MKKAKGPLTDEEKVIELLIETLKEDVDGNGLYVWVGKECLKRLGGIKPSEGEFLRTLYVLKVKSFIDFDGNTNLEELRTMKVYLLPRILDYFEEKERTRIARRREQTQFWLPLAISIAALVAPILIELL